MFSIAVTTGCAPSDRPAPQAVSPPAEIVADEPVGATPQLTRADLMGLSVDELYTVLGTPSLRRTEKKAQYWRYHYPGCQVDIYAFSNEAEHQAHVRYVRLRPDQTTSVAYKDPFCQALATSSNEPSISPKPPGLINALPR